MDVLTSEQRHRCMATIRARNTKPEIMLRKALFAAGLRYRLHDRRLPGTPDLLFPKYRAALFVHGCFWHGHTCRLFVTPATNREFWLAKIGVNRRRDREATKALAKMEWRVLTVWECALRGRDRAPVEDLAAKVGRWLRSNSKIGEIPAAGPDH